MIKFKHIFLLGIVSLLVYACGSQGGIPVDNFDHAAQAVRDNDTIVKFLQNHYYDATEDIVKRIDAGQTSLFNDTKLRTQDVVETINDVAIDYKLYTYVIDEGTSPKGNPTVVDSVLVSYHGQRILNTEDLSAEFDRNTNLWFVLGAGVIRGWSYGFTNFKGGTNITTPGNPLTFENTGKGIIFIPSGLAYRNQGNNAIQANESLMFYVELNDIVEDTDSDRDGVPSILEDLNGDGIPWNDDTDEDNAFNFVDNDDDGDGILTIFEDANKDGDPTNDFSDPDNPTLPDYLNPNIRVSNR
ncbi:FKBP-type peptidyl-prolyl cis-trans isomerase [Tenacibaculum amylolyticum]|uniref:FKBP-type peptidyl-prolyl cis-trans isomerase n=1 Tax=Tenacibaculum amylolyticum TaxID=104269 RepID=UPI0038948BF1